MKTFKIEIKWAFIFVMMMLLWMAGERLSGLHDVHIDKHPIYSNFIAIPAIVIYVWALLDKKKNHYNGVMTYGQGFKAGAVITLIITLLSPITQYIISTFISPDYFTNAIKYSVEDGHLSQEAAEDYFNFKSYVIQGLVGTLIMGLFTTSIVAIFTRTRPEKERA